MDGVDEETYREEDITLALDNHFPCGVSNLQWSVITKERDEEMIVKITRLKVEKDEDIAIEAHLKARTDSERREDSRL